MKRVAPFVRILGILAVSLGLFPALGLPYQRLDWIAYSQGYGVVENLALNQPAFASSFLPDHPPSFVTDGNLETEWQAPSYFPQWIYVLWDTPQRLNQVVINWGAGYARRYRIAVLAGERHYRYWQLVYEEVAGDGGLDFITIPSVSGSAVLVQMYGRAPDALIYAIREIEVFYLPEEQQEDGNLAAGRLAYATSYQPGYEPSKATDTDFATSWRSDPRFDPYTSSIYVDLGDGYDVGEVHLYWGDPYANRFRLYAWVFVRTGPFGQWAWVPLYAGRSAGGQDVASFHPVQTRYVRLVAYNGAGLGVDLQEFEVYAGSQGPADTDPPPAGTGLPQWSLGKEGELLQDWAPAGWEQTPRWKMPELEDGLPAIPELQSVK